MGLGLGPMFRGYASLSESGFEERDLVCRCRPLVSGLTQSEPQLRVVSGRGISPGLWFYSGFFVIGVLGSLVSRV